MAAHFAYIHLACMGHCIIPRCWWWCVSGGGRIARLRPMRYVCVWHSNAISAQQPIFNENEGEIKEMECECVWNAATPSFPLKRWHAEVRRSSNILIYMIFDLPANVQWVVCCAYCKQNGMPWMLTKACVTRCQLPRMQHRIQILTYWAEINKNRRPNTGKGLQLPDDAGLSGVSACRTLCARSLARFDVDAKQSRRPDCDTLHALPSEPLRNYYG